MRSRQLSLYCCCQTSAKNKSRIAEVAQSHGAASGEAAAAAALTIIIILPVVPLDGPFVYARDNWDEDSSMEQLLCGRQKWGEGNQMRVNWRANNANTNDAKQAWLPVVLFLLFSPMMLSPLTSNSTPPQQQPLLLLSLHSVAISEWPPNLRRHCNEQHLLANRAQQHTKAGYEVAVRRTKGKYKQAKWEKTVAWFIYLFAFTSTHKERPHYYQIRMESNLDRTSRDGGSGGGDGSSRNGFKIELPRRWILHCMSICLSTAGYCCYRIVCLHCFRRRHKWMSNQVTRDSFCAVWLATIWAHYHQPVSKRTHLTFL